MKKLDKIRGSRDCSLVEVTLYIANLAYQIKKERVIFEDLRLPHDTRAEAYNRMLRAKELLDHWKEVRKDILKNISDGGVK